MIDRGDDEPRFMETVPQAQFIGFQSDGAEVGKLWLEDPIRFEGDAEEAAQVFFDYVVKLNNTHILELNKRIEELEEQYAEAVTQRDLARG